MSAFEINDELFEECKCIDKFLQKPIMMVDLINEVKGLIKEGRTKPDLQISASKF